MTTLPAVQTGALTHLDKRRVTLFAKTVGKDLVGSEIDEAIEMCSIYQANPFVKDLFFIPFGEYGKPNRKVQAVLSIGLYRKIAARSGHYRPDDKAPRFTYDELARSPANPKGIVDCEVSVYRWSHGEWHPITSRLRWEERAPIVDDPEAFEWVDTGETWADSGKPKKTKRLREGLTEAPKFLDPKKPNWHSMPETLLSKCVEADCLRKGWPNELQGSYSEGELDQHHSQAIELTASEIVEAADREDRVARVGGFRNVTVDWCDGEPLQLVPTGEFHDKVMAFIKAHMKKGEEQPAHVATWASRNSIALKQYWADDKAAALNLKKELERVTVMAKQPEASGQ